MEDKELKHKIIKELRQAAFDKEIPRYMVLIYEHLMVEFTNNNPQFFFSIHEPQVNKFVIHLILRPRVTSDESFIKDANAVFVYDEHNHQGLESVRGYIEGDWEDVIIEWGKKAEKIERETYFNEIQEREQQLFRAFGLLDEKNEYVKCFDEFGEELMKGDTVDVQSVGEYKIYEGDDGQLYFKPYGKEERVSAYFSNDIIKII